MAINNPLSTSTPAAGGILVPDEFAQVLIQGTLDESAAASLAGNVSVTSAKRINFPVLTDTPSASFVEEGAPKPTSGAGFGQFQLNTKKLAVIIPMSMELVEDSATDPRVLIDAPVRRAFAKTIDQHLLGRNGASVVTTQFENALCDSTQTVERGTEGDALRVAVSAAMGDVESNGYTPNGIILPSDGRQHIRDARKAVETTDPVYTGSEYAYGLRSAYSSNLYAMGGAQDEQAIGVVGDFSNLYIRVRSDLSVAVSDTATITINGNPVNLWESNLVALRYEMRVAAGAFDLDRAFSVITNPAA